MCRVGTPGVLAEVVQNFAVPVASVRPDVGEPVHDPPVTSDRESAVLISPVIIVDQVRVITLPASRLRVARDLLAEPSPHVPMLFDSPAVEKLGLMHPTVSQLALTFLEMCTALLGLADGSGASLGLSTGTAETRLPLVAGELFTALSDADVRLLHVVENPRSRVADFQDITGR